MVEVCQLFPGITLRCFPDDRFKQGCLSVQIVRPMCREEAARNALLPAVLLRGSTGSPDMRSITLRLDDLYGASVGTSVRRVGDYQTTGLYCGFVEDRFALEGDAVFGPAAEFLFELLLSPRLEKGAFCSDFVRGEKVNLISTIEAQRNDKRAYAMEKLMEQMCSEDSFGLPRLGTVEQVQAITPESLYSHYCHILRHSPIEIFYVGSRDLETVVKTLQPLLAALERDYVNLPAQTPFRGGTQGEFTETMDVNQGKLCMGFVTPTVNTCPGFAAMQVCNAVFGGGMTSKLFMQLREKMSLCYAIGSGYHGVKGIMTVSAGIDSANKDLTQKEILRQLEKTAAGEITPGELESAKQSLCNSLLSLHDSPGAIESFYATAALSGLPYTREEYIRAVEQVTAQQVAQQAALLRLHSVFFLQGVAQ